MPARTITLGWLNSATRSQMRCTWSSRCDDSSTVVPACFSSPISSRNSIVAWRSTPDVGSSRIAIAARLTMISANPIRCRIPREKSRDTLVRDVGQVDARQRIRNALRPLGERKPHQLGGVAQVFNGGEMIVEADRIQQIADATLGLKRLTRRIE